jgi:hypothetical protein
VANTDPLTGGFLSYINLESVDALEIIPAGAGAEFGRAQGGFANIVQKQGGNTFEGVAGILFGGSFLDGNGAAGGEGPEFTRSQPFVQLSGPILRDRLWYRLSHEWIAREDPVNVLSRVETTKQKQGIHSDQLTWQVTPRNKLALQVQRDPLKYENVGVGTFAPADTSHVLERGGTTTSLAWTAPYSARVFAEGLVALQDHREEIYPQSPGMQGHCGLPIYDDPYSVTFTSLAHSQCYEVKTGHLSGSYPIDSRDQRSRFTMRGQVTVSPGSAGAVTQQFKTGFSVENENYFRNLSRGVEGNVKPLNFWRPDLGHLLHRDPRARHLGVRGRRRQRRRVLRGSDPVRPPLDGHRRIALGPRGDRQRVEGGLRPGGGGAPLPGSGGPGAWPPPTPSCRPSPASTIAIASRRTWAPSWARYRRRSPACWSRAPAGRASASSRTSRSRTRRSPPAWRWPGIPSARGRPSWP